MSYRDFVRDLDNGMTGDVIFFYGAEDHLMEWATDRLIERSVPEEWRSIDVRYLDGTICGADEIMGEARAYSMFSDKRVVIVKNYLPVYRKTSDSSADDLVAFAAERKGSSMLVFVTEAAHTPDMTAYGKKLMSKCSAYEFSRLDRGELKGFITKRIHAGSKMIGRRELDQIIDLSGYYNRESAYDLRLLDADIDKLIKACDGDTISTDLIEDLLIGDSDRFVFDLVDALVKGDRSKALEITETIIHGDSGAASGVISLITRQFEIMQDSLELSERGYSVSQMSKATGVNEYRFRKAYQAAGAYSKARVRGLLKQLYNIDRDIKRGDIDRDTALELFAVTASPSR